MANTYTTRFNLTKPEVGSDTNAWGGHLNQDLDTIDANMVSLLSTTPQTMVGALNLPGNGLNVGSGQLLVSGGNVSTSGNFVAVSATFSGTLSTTGAGSFGSAAITGAATIGTTLSVGGLVSAATAPTLGQHLTNKTYTDATYVPLAGGTMTGNLTIVNSTNEMRLKLGTATGSFYGNGVSGGYAGFRNDSGTPLVYWDMSGNFGTAGTITCGSSITATGNITAYSDAKLKTNVETILAPLSLVNRMRGVFYDRIDNGEHGVGVIAQEMREILPQVVHENDGTLSVAYGNIVGVLIEAVKELSAKVMELEASK